MGGLERAPQAPLSGSGRPGGAVAPLELRYPGGTGAPLGAGAPLDTCSEREPQREAAALPRRALHGHGAAVGFGNVTHQRQPDAAAAPALGLAPADPVKLLEDPRMLGGGDTHAAIGHAEGESLA